MERALKERIIGATVLVAVVVLVVPVFLDGPPEEADIVSERISLPGQSDTGKRTIVLDRDRTEPVPGNAQQEPAPATAEAPRQAEAPAPEGSAAAPSSSATAPATPSGQDAGESGSEPATTPATGAGDRSATGMWAVQLGSFSNEANAERLAAELRQQGFAAFLSRITTGGGELHRVRVGPQRDREAAEAMLARLEQAGQQGQVVPHP